MVNDRVSCRTYSTPHPIPEHPLLFSTIFTVSAITLLCRSEVWQSFVLRISSYFLFLFGYLLGPYVFFLYSQLMRVVILFVPPLLTLFNWCLPDSSIEQKIAWLHHFLKQSIYVILYICNIISLSSHPFFSKVIFMDDLNHNFCHNAQICLE